MVDTRGQRGFAIIIAICATALIASAVLLVGRHLQIRFDEHRLDKRDVHLVALSDAAMAETLASVAANPGFGGISARPFGGGTIESLVVADGTGSLIIEAHGTWGGWVMDTWAEVEMSPSGPTVRRWKRGTRPAS